MGHQNMHTKRPTIMDVARQASVSRATASRVLNHGPGVSVEVRRRVQQVIEDLGYRPDPAAQALASGRSEVIELVVLDNCGASFGSNPYYGRVVTGVVGELTSTHAQLRIHVVDRAHAQPLLGQIAQTASLGAVLVNVPAPLAEEFYLRCDRVVSIGRSAPGVPWVEPEKEAGASAAVTPRQRGGRRRIAAI